MDGLSVFFLIFLAIALLIFIMIYNGHVNRRNSVDYAYSAIDVQLKKRWDLVPQIVNTVKAYAEHEKVLFENVVRARQQAKKKRDDSRGRFDGERHLDQQLPLLMAVAEAYPDLKADQQFLNLQRNLTEIEAQISASHRAYNATVMNYNNGVDMLPSSIIAAMRGFRRRQYFAASAQESQAQSIHV